MPSPSMCARSEQALLSSLSVSIAPVLSWFATALQTILHVCAVFSPRLHVQSAPCITVATTGVHLTRHTFDIVSCISPAGTASPPLPASASPAPSWASACWRASRASTGSSSCASLRPGWRRCCWCSHSPPRCSPRSAPLTHLAKNGCAHRRWRGALTT